MAQINGLEYCVLCLLLTFRIIHHIILIFIHSTTNYVKYGLWEDAENFEIFFLNSNIFIIHKFTTVEIGVFCLPGLFCLLACHCFSITQFILFFCYLYYA